MNNRLVRSNIRSRKARVLMLAAGSFLTLTLAACQGGGGGSGGAGDGLSSDSYAQAYARGNYQQAYTQAAAAATSTTGPDHERAALVAGMSAAALGKQSDAARWLIPRAESGDRYIAGKAAWTLGQMGDVQNRPGDAGRWYVQAGKQLDADDAARAAMAGGDAFRRAGDDSAAADAYALARSKAQEDALRQSIDARASGPVPSAPTTVSLGTWSSPAGAGGSPSPAVGSRLASMELARGNRRDFSAGLCASTRVVNGAGYRTDVAEVTVRSAPGGAAPASVATAPVPTGPFTIQLAAFADRQRASQQQRTAQSPASRAGLASPQIVPITDRTGKTLYAVRIGTYSSKDAAQSDLARLGLPGIVTAERP